MLLKDYLSRSFSNYPKGIKNTKELMDMIQKSIREEYPSNISIRTYKVLSTKQLIIHCKLPSRKRKNLSFDVVFQVALDDINDPTATSILNAPIRVFSNSPSFYYSNAKVFLEKKLLCEWLKDKYDAKIFEEDPTKRNPDKEIKYERTIYTVGYWLANNHFKEKSISAIYRLAVPLSYTTIASHVQTQRTIESLYETKKDTKAEAERKKGVEERKAARKYVAPISTATPAVKSTNASKRVSYSSKVKHSSKVQKSKKVK